jgi:prefoldin subunit 5
VEEALEKVRRDFADYERLIERLKKELEEKKGQLGQREEEIRSLEAGFKAQRSMEKMEQLEQAQHRIRTL